MIVDISDSLKALLESIFKGEDKTSCVWECECTFKNPDGYEYKSRYVRDLTITQMFLTSYMDTIQLVIDMRPTEQMELLKHIQNLSVGLVLYPVDNKSGNIIQDQEPIIFEAKVFLENQQDLEQKYGTGAFGNQETNTNQTPSQNEQQVPITFHLITEFNHTVRQIGLNVILNNVTMYDVVSWVAQQFNVLALVMKPADNTTVYSSVIIPPMKYASDIFPYLQIKYGIYSKGLGYYFSNEKLYVYPLYGVDEDDAPEACTMQLVHAPENYFKGLTKYHKLVDNEVYIAATNKKDIRSLEASGAENQGNTIVSLNADTLKDRFVNIGKDGKVTVDQTAITVISQQNSATNTTSGMQNIKFTGESTNIYNSTSDLASHNGKLLSTTWSRAVPWSLPPGMHVEYSFDYYNKDTNTYEFTTRKGTLLNVSYMCQVQPATNSQVPWLTFTAAMQFFIEPDHKSDDDFQYN